MAKINFQRGLRYQKILAAVSTTSDTSEGDLPATKLASLQVGAPSLPGPRVDPVQHGIEVSVTTTSRRRTARAVLRIVDSVAGLPPRTSYTWGGRLTPLPFAIFYIVTLVRAVSPLQWFKFLYRIHGRSRSTTNLRRDFPAAFTEWYFLTLTSVSLVIALANLTVPDWLIKPSTVVGWWIIVDCTVWILYYLFLRFFIEGKFDAYHAIEYLLQFPLVAGLQCTVIAIVLDVPIITVIDGLRGSGSLGGRAGGLLGMLGVVYLGGALSVLISALPPIRARGADGIAILGAGDVTSERILPALLAIGVRPTEISLLDLEPKTIHGYRAFDGSSRELRTKLSRMHVPTIIATPTDSHLEYAASLSADGVRFAIEKPVCAGKRGRLRIEQNPAMFENAFALSYYALEKALPLNYLMTRRDAYLPYLENTDGSSICQSEVEELVDRLGELCAVDVRVLEGASRSPSGTQRVWTEQPETGISALVETAIHPLHLLCLFVPESSNLKIERVDVARYRPRDDEVRAANGAGVAPTFIDVRGVVDGADVRIVVGKHIPDEGTERVLEARFANGRVVCRFDQRDVRVFLDDAEDHNFPDLTIRVPSAMARYTVQMSLFRDFVDRGWGHDRFDDLDRQLRALGYWEQVAEAGATRIVTDYDDGIRVHPDRLLFG